VIDTKEAWSIFTEGMTRRRRTPSRPIDRQRRRQITGDKIAGGTKSVKMLYFM
jgi:hypothetical protein